MVCQFVTSFLTFNFGDVPPFWDLGNIVAFGMTMAFLFSTTLLPALIAIFPLWKKKKVQEQKKGSSWYSNLGLWVVKRPKGITVASLAIIVGLAYLGSFNVFNDEFVEYFDTSVKFRQDSDFINENLTGFYNVEFSVGSGESGGINSPEYLQKLNEFENWLENQPEVVHVNAFTEVARRVNKSMHGDDKTYYKVPQGLRIKEAESSIKELHKHFEVVGTSVLESIALSQEELIPIRGILNLLMT